MPCSLHKAQSLLSHVTFGACHAAVCSVPYVQAASTTLPVALLPLLCKCMLSLLGDKLNSAPSTLAVVLVGSCCLIVLIVNVVLTNCLQLPLVIESKVHT